MSIMVGTGRGAQSGVLIRNAEALETLEQVDTLVVDKTGTLTEGKPHLVTVRTIGAVDEARMLQLAASVERSSEHPLASAIVSEVQKKGIALTPATEFQSMTSKGVTPSPPFSATLMRASQSSSESPRSGQPQTRLGSINDLKHPHHAQVLMVEDMAMVHQPSGEVL
jgi:Cu+-exporting ATPase